MPSFTLCFRLACTLLVVACSSEPRSPKPPDTFSVFPNLPLPPSAQLVSRAGSEDALQIRLLSAAPPDQVTDYYRDVLTKGRWRLISDIKNRDGSVVLYAEQDGPPLWVRIWPTSDGAGTMVELSGAVVAKQADSVKVDKSGSKTSPKPGK
jgi:hypothetical protein